jgi:hypothetical protein
VHKLPKEPSGNISSESLKLELVQAKSFQEKCFLHVLRFIRWQRKNPASGGAEQLRRDVRLCELLTEYESQSEIVGMIEFLCHLRTRKHPLKAA